MSASFKDLRFDEAGLVCVVAQDAATGTVRMVAWANRDALDATARTGLAHFWSRSRRRLWQKGEESGKVLRVRAIWADCDGDAVIYRVDPHGPTCHTGAETCFFRRLEPASEAETAPVAPGSILAALDAVLAERAGRSATESYVASLLDDPPRALAKVIEEAGELCVAVEREGDAAVTHELADLVFHALVAARSRGITSEACLRALALRFGVGGHAEKAARGASKSPE